MRPKLEATASTFQPEILLCEDTSRVTSGSLPTSLPTPALSTRFKQGVIASDLVAFVFATAMTVARMGHVVRNIGSGQEGYHNSLKMVKQSLAVWKWETRK